MKYDIFSSVPPAMPKPGKGTEIIHLITSQVSSEMKNAIAPTIFPPLARTLRCCCKDFAFFLQGVCDVVARTSRCFNRQHPSTLNIKIYF